MVTYIKHPDTDEDLEIKTGFDGCAHYKIGDRINNSSTNDDHWGPEGHADNGVYLAYGNTGPVGWFVIICNIIVSFVYRDDILKRIPKINKG